MLKNGSLLDVDYIPTFGAEGTTETLATGLAGDTAGAYDLDAEITLASTNAPMITSRFICTPGCTSPGGGSFCSYCC